MTDDEQRVWNAAEQAYQRLSDAKTPRAKKAANQEYYAALRDLFWVARAQRQHR